MPAFFDCGDSSGNFTVMTIEFKSWAWCPHDWTKLILGWAAVLLTVLSAQAQSNWRGDALVQRLPDQSAYAEVQTAWDPDTTLSDGRLTMTVIASQSDEIVAFDKIEIPARQAISDSIELEYVHVKRLSVPVGSVIIDWQVQRGDSTIWLHNQNIYVPIGGAPTFSDPILVKTFAPQSALSQSDMVHSGLDIFPSVGRRIPLDVSSARFYFEIHGVSDVVGMDSLFLLSLGWADADGNWDLRATKHARMKAGQVVPVFESLPCTPSSPLVINPILKLEARTREGHVIVSRDVQLPSRMSEEIKDVEGSALPVLPSLLSIKSLDSLIRHVEDHLPVASINEQNTIQFSLLPNASVPQIHQYLTSFWLERGQSNEEASRLHAQYCDRIAFVDENFGDCKYGQGSLTEMGNIYLRFGSPNTVVQRHHETEYYPYEIWHYYKAGRFNNKRFLFYAPHVVGECFELLHSDMLGERQNEDWLSQLRSRENRIRVSESMENRMNPRDSFSREEPEDLFYNPR